MVREDDIIKVWFEEVEDGGFGLYSTDDDFFSSRY